MEETIVYSQYTDKTTGEIRKETRYRFPSAFDDENGYLFWAKEGGAKSFYNVKYPREMTVKEIGYMSMLSKEMWGNTNMLGYRGHGGIIPYEEEEIGGLIGLKSSQTKSFIRKMMKLGMMAKVVILTEGEKHIQFYISPVYFFSSKRVSLNLYLIFREQLDSVIPEWAKARFAEADRKKKQREDTKRERNNI